MGGRRWQLALALAGGLGLAGLEHNVVICSATVEACCHEGSAQWQRALELLRQMYGISVPANSLTYSSAIGACTGDGDACRAPAALGLLAELQQRVARLL